MRFLKELPYYLKGLITNKLHKTKKFQHFKEDDVWVKTNQYVNIDGEKYEPGTYHLKCLHKNSISLLRRLLWK